MACRAAGGAAPRPSSRPITTTNGVSRLPRTFGCSRSSAWSSFQSGLSWRTILAKRENFRRAFDGFDFHQIVRYGEKQVARLLQDEGIVRHRGKIEAVIHNAACAAELQAECGSLAAYFWRFEIDRAAVSRLQAVSVSPESIALSKDLKKRGWKFVGPTTAYAFMQAMGLVNDHAPGCVVADKVAQARKAFQVPT
jgi:DNA-3-methyladenine glycosylase I